MALRSGFAAAVLAILLAVPATAGAATSVRVEGDTLIVETDAGDVNELSVFNNTHEDSCGNPFSNPCGSIEVRDFGAEVEKGAGCGGSVTVHLCGGPSTVNVLATLLDGDDEYGGGADRHHRVDAGVGNDRVFTGDGADTLALGEGDDVGVPGTGSDTVDAGPGDDSVDSTDFRLEPEADTVTCGPGTDRAVVDPMDQVDASCERVLVAGTGPAMAVDLPARRKVSKLVGRGFSFSVEVDDSCTLGATLTLTRASARRYHVVRRIAAAKASPDEPGTVKLKLRPSARIRDRLEGARRLKGKLEVICKTGRGRTTSVESLTFKR